MDIESSAWLTALQGQGPQRSAALVRLHELLLKVGTREAHRRGPAARISGPELDDLAHQAANDAMLALLAKIDSFRGESRFTTWAYRFVVLEVASKLGRHFSRRPAAVLNDDDWTRIAARLGADPLMQAEQRDLVAAVRRAVEEALTAHQRDFFVAVVIQGASTDEMAARSGVSPGAVYKTVFDARRKIRAYLTANGYLEAELRATPVRPGRVRVDGREQVVGVD
jgi:RNA polymerase sigma-70 factor (ECF subfamily)